MKEGRKSQIEERHYDIWINPDMKDNYQKDFTGTRRGLALMSQILEDSASAKMVSDGKIGKRDIPMQTFYISPGVTVIAMYNPEGDKKLKKVICTGHPEDQEASKSVLERLIGIESGIERIKLNYSYTQPI